MSSRRNVFVNLDKPIANHAGLWLDKFLTTQQESTNNNEQPKTRLVNEVGTIAQPEIYTKFYQRWKQTLEQISDVQTGKATVQGRMAVGLGTESVLETSIKLYHTYGVPYIPASALKGVAASYARDYLHGWEQTSSNYVTVFGTSTDEKNDIKEAAGFVTFYDALYVPDSGINKQALHADVITVHHQDYYQDKNLAPADWDSTTPISFLTATGEYLIALSGPEDWVSLTFDILKEALKELGVGAKTSSGYGRMELEIPERKISVENQSVAVLEKKETKIEDPMIMAINNLPNNRFAGEIGNYIKKWEDITEPSQKLKVAEVIIKRADEVDKKKFKDKSWYEKFKNYSAS
ncbi:MAG: type III-B CRISPR module RAMP protein Cmr6 [Acidobacteria bacterium]|nr:type III-B CRISPR module RAMP protein Cmr6 [Acidobacteriota bacterium]